LDVTRTEEEQLEAIKKWWVENGWSIVGGIVIGLGAIFGWRGWEAYQLTQAEAASDIYTGLIGEVRQNKNDEARASANKLLDDYSATSYAIFASLIMAKLDVEAGDPAAAIQHLQWVMDKTGQNEFKHLARLRMARILLDDNKADQALALVLSVSEPGEFTASYEEIKGDIYTRQGEIDKAKIAYQQAQSGMGDTQKENTFLQMKIDDIGRLHKE